MGSLTKGLDVGLEVREPPVLREGGDGTGLAKGSVQDPPLLYLVCRETSSGRGLRGRPPGDECGPTPPDSTASSAV